MSKQFYLSLNARELAAFEVAGHDEIALYLILKKLADFKTGTIGKHPQSKTTCQKLAEKLSRGPTQGKPGQSYDRKQIIRLLDRMQLRGMVIRDRTEEENLIMSLPLSPMEYKEKDATGETSADMAVPKKLSRKAAGTPSPSLDSVESEPFHDYPSVLISNFSTINTPNNGELDSWGGVENPAWDVTAIKALMASRPTMLYPESATSIAIYTRWVKAGVTEAELMEAIALTEADFTVAQKPNDVDEVLRKSKQLQKRGNVGLVL